MEKTLPDVLLFQGIRKEEIQSVCTCLGARRKSFDRGELLLHAGEPAAYMGLVLRGGVNIEAHSYWGGSNLFGHVGPGEIFAEAYAVIPGREMLVDVVANEPTDVLFLPAARLLEPCAKACPFHTRLLQNLLQILARKNLHLSTRMMHTASRSIRARLLSYLSEQAVEHGSNRFAIWRTIWGWTGVPCPKSFPKCARMGCLPTGKTNSPSPTRPWKLMGKKLANGRDKTTKIC